MRASLCRLLDAMASVPPFSWILPTPACLDWKDLLDHLLRRVDEGPTFLEDLLSPAEIEGLRVVDVGCGMGDRTVVAARCGASLAVGIDSDPEKLRWARRLLRHTGTVGTRFVQGSADALPLRDGSFDLVLLLDVVEHLEDPLRALEELARILRPGGRVLVTFPPYRSPWGAHLVEHVRLPWAHLLCPEDDLLALWRSRHRMAVARGRVTTSRSRAHSIEAARTLSELWSLNRMTIGRFLELVQAASLELAGLRLHSPLGLAAPLARARRLREYLFTRLAALLRKPDQPG